MNIKEELHRLCVSALKQKVAEIESVIAERREAIAGETKSSMGDKYETTREMLQQDINMSLDRLNKVNAELEALLHINTEINHTTVNNGSVVTTNNGNYFLAVSAGKFLLEGQYYYAISGSSPIGTLLKGKQKGDSFHFNNKDYIVKDII
ncbi:MAG: 3-oxoacyl-ACP synthase [Chitinophagales bacterium]|nr:hypothetical protein [Chitinophagaceae bacterium]MCB9065233.1 3-oxoacyl-ACP synthase [Chitinophagales bacterium]